MSEILSIHFDQTEAPETNSSVVGRTGEYLASRYLIKNGLKLVCANFKVPIGRNRRGVAVTGEIDLIALENNVLCFIEVKTRSSDEFASPLAAVDLRKQRQIIRTARVYRKIFNIQGIKFRYDAISIVLEKNKRPKIEHFKNYWSEDKFRNKFWNEEIWQY